jgi:hypothetical protein
MERGMGGACETEDLGTGCGREGADGELDGFSSKAAARARTDTDGDTSAGGVTTAGVAAAVGDRSSSGSASGRLISEWWRTIGAVAFAPGGSGGSGQSSSVSSTPVEFAGDWSDVGSGRGWPGREWRRDTVDARDAVDASLGRRGGSFGAADRGGTGGAAAAGVFTPETWLLSASRRLKGLSRIDAISLGVSQAGDFGFHGAFPFAPLGLNTRPAFGA